MKVNYINIRRITIKAKRKIFKQLRKNVKASYITEISKIDKKIKQCAKQGLWVLGYKIKSYAFSWRRIERLYRLRGFEANWNIDRAIVTISWYT